MHKQLLIPALLVPLLALLWWARPAPLPPPNVLLVIWDTARADHMSVYGHDRPTTPNLARFAAQAQVFEQAISPGTWTIPSHASIFTGLSVRTHGANAGWRWLDDHHLTLAEHLAANGYDTFLFSANPYLSQGTNLTQGFQVRRHSWTRRAAAKIAQSKLIPRDKSTEISPSFEGGPNVAWKQSLHKEAAGLANRSLARWLSTREDPSQPWFATLNLMEAHSPRIPRLASRKKVSTPAELELGLATDVSLWKEVSAILGQHHYSDAEIQAIRTVYDASLVDLDVAFGKLIRGMAKRGLLQNTIVILTSDHGESLGEHGLFEHRYGVYQPLIHVPLIVRYPAKLPPQRVTDPVSTAAIFATIVDLAGLPMPPQAIEPSLRTPPPLVFSELTNPFTSKLAPFKEAYPDVDYSRFDNTYRAIIQGDQKLIESDLGSELFFLSDDPGELNDHYTPQTPLVPLLHTHLNQLSVADPTLRSAHDLQKQHGEEQANLTEMLTQLGYAE